MSTVCHVRMLTRPDVPKPYAVDAASGVYLLGRRSERRVQPREIVESYRGAQR